MEEEEFDFNNIVDPPKSEFDFSDIVDEFDFSDVAEEPSVGDNIMAGLNAISRGFYNTVVTTPLKVGGMIQRGAASLIGYPDQAPLPQTTMNLESAGQATEQLMEEVSPRYNNVNPLVEGVGEGVGQGLGMWLTAGQSPAGLTQSATKVPTLMQATGTATKQLAGSMATPTGVLGGAMSGIPEYENAKAAGASEAEAFALFMKNYAVGQTEALPIANFLKRLDGATGNRLLNTLVAQGKGSIEEFVQEGIQTYLSNQFASASYDPDRDPFFQVLESAEVGGIVGFLLPGIAGFAQSLPTGQKVKLEKKINDIQAKEVVDEVGDTGDPELNAEIDANAAVTPVEKEQVLQEQITQENEEKIAEQQAEFKQTESEVISNLDKAPEEIVEEQKAEDVKETPEYKEAVQKVADLQAKFSEADPEASTEELYAELVSAKSALRRLVPEKSAKPAAKKTDTQKKIEDATGVTKQPKTLVDTSKALKDQIQIHYKGVQEGVIKGKDITNSLVTKVQEAIKDSPLNPKQISSILTRVKKTNLFTPGSISRLNTFIDKVSTDAVYADKVSEAKSLNSKIRKLSKGKDTSQAVRGLAKVFASLNPEDGDIDAHLDWARQIEAGLKSPTNPNYKMFNAGEAQQYIDDILDKQVEADAEEAKAAEQRGESRNVQLFSNLKSSLDAIQNFDTSGLDEDQQRIVQTLKGIDPTALQDDQATKIVRVIDNILENEDFSNASRVESIAKAQQNLKELSSKVDTSKLKDIGGLGRLAASTYQQYERITGEAGVAAEVQRLSGIFDVFSGGSRVENQENKFKEGLEEKIKQIKKKTRVNAVDPLNQVRLVIFSELYRNYGDDSHIPKVKKNIERTIKEYELTDEDAAKNWKKAYEEFKDVSKVDEAPNKLDPALFEVWKYINNYFQTNVNSRLQKVAEELHNRPYVEANNYSHSKQIATTDTKAQKEEAKETSSATKSGVRSKQAYTAITATRTLRPGHAYASDFFDAQIDGVRKSLYDIEVSRAEELVAETIFTPEFARLVGGEQNAKITRAMYTSARRIQRAMGRPSSNEAVRFLNSATQFIRNLGSVRALASLSAPLKQVPSVWWKAALNHAGSGSMDSFLRGVRAVSLSGPSQGLKNLFDMYTIGVRGQRLGGMERGDSISFKLDLGAKQGAAKGAEWLRDKSEYFSRKAMWTLTNSDVYAARTTWLGYYLQSLKEQGVAQINLHTEFQKQGEESRKKAAAFAEQMVATTQVPSNPATLSQIGRNENDGAYNFIKNMLIPFSMFSMNAKYRMISNADKWVRNRTWKNASAIAGDFSENLIFAGIAAGVLSYYKDGIRSLIESLFNLDAGGDDEKDDQNRVKGFYTNLINASVPFSIGTWGESGTAKFANNIAYIANNPDVDYNTWKKETGGFVFDPTDRQTNDYGLIGLGLEPFREAADGAIDLTRAEFDLPVRYESFGRTEEVDLTEAQKKLLALKVMMEAANIVGINEADLFNQVRKVYKEQLKLAKGSNTENKPKIRLN
jgi:hypothetical protein